MQTELKVAEFIRRYSLIRKGDTVTVGVSGGADSLSLLFLLHSLGYDVRAVHVHHGIRGGTADEDERFALKMCDRLGVPVTGVHVDVPALSAESSESLEEAGRRARYGIFLDMARRFAARVAVGHHMDDQAETVLHNMIRGTGPAGMAGMRPVSPLPWSDGEAVLIRPLLCLGRRDIEEYLRARNIPWRDDETNLSLEYTRNRIRHVILPAAVQINSRAAAHIARAAESMALERDFIEEKVRGALELYLKKEGNSLRLDGAIYEKEHQLIVQEAVRECIGMSRGGLKDITAGHVDQVIDLLRQRVTGRGVDLPGSVRARLSYGELIFERKDGPAAGQAAGQTTGQVTGQMPGTSVTIIDRGDERGPCDFPKDSCIKWFDYDKINGCVSFRHRREGDYIVTGAGRELLSDFFIRQKVDRSLRDDALLMVRDEGSEILWVKAGDLSRVNVRYLTDESTARILEARIIYE